jgi:hypothetical protein
MKSDGAIRHKARQVAYRHLKRRLQEQLDSHDPSLTKETIKEEFRQFLATAPLHEIASEFPDLAALLWVLDGEGAGREIEVEEENWEKKSPVFPVTVEEGLVLEAKTKEDADEAEFILRDIRAKATWATREQEAAASKITGLEEDLRKAREDVHAAEARGRAEIEGVIKSLLGAEDQNESFRVRIRRRFGI